MNKEWRNRAESIGRANKVVSQLHDAETGCTLVTLAFTHGEEWSFPMKIAPNFLELINLSKEVALRHNQTTQITSDDKEYIYNNFETIFKNGECFWVVANGKKEGHVFGVNNSSGELYYFDDNGVSTGIFNTSVLKEHIDGLPIADEIKEITVIKFLAS